MNSKSSNYYGLIFKKYIFCVTGYLPGQDAAQAGLLTGIYQL